MGKMNWNKQFELITLWGIGLGCFAISGALLLIFIRHISDTIHGYKSENLDIKIKQIIMKGIRRNLYQIKLGMDKVDAERLIMECYQFDLTAETIDVEISTEFKIEKKYEYYGEKETKQILLYHITGLYSFLRSETSSQKMNAAVTIDYVNDKVTAIRTI